LGDNCQLWSDRRHALGQNILSARDWAGNGSPEVRGDGAHVLVADARLDNRAELIAALPGSRRAAGISESSLLLDCLLAWDLDALDRIVGDFAFAWWDRQRETLTLARDYIGQRPLHYAAGASFFAFSSMPRGLHALPEVPRCPSVDAATRFMTGRSQLPGHSFFDGVSQLAPGHVLTMRRQAVYDRRWWYFRHADPPPRTLNEAAERARELIDQAVADRLLGGGNIIASHLSAGLDSSAVTESAARQLGESGKRLIAYTDVPSGNYPNPAMSLANEGALAKLVSSQAGNIDHVEIQGTGSLVDVFDRNVRLWERPVPNPFNDLWWSAITNDAARRGASVLLTAPMGNIGLSHSGDERLSELFAAFRWGELAQAFAARRRLRPEGLATLVNATVGPLLPLSLSALIARGRGRGADNPFLLKSAGSPDSAPIARDSLRRRLQLIAWTDPGSFTAGAAAGWHVDMRDPTADRRLMEFTLGLPTEFYWNGGMGRGLARRAMAGRLPTAIVEEQRKGRQSADWYTVLLGNRDALIAEAEALGRSQAAEIIDWRAIRHALQTLSDREPESVKAQRVYGHSLVQALSAGHFLRSN
jgi:asparagine synthase (glutamine-hydrolysing)